MYIKAIKTHIINANDSLEKILDQYIPVLLNEDIVVITSKILSVLQNRLVSKESIEKRTLIRQEADLVLESDYNSHPFYLTIKNGILIPSAGIDESNSNDCYILYPEHIQETAAWIWNTLKQKHHLDKLGIVITDSHTTVMRGGVTGIALGWCGFKPLYSYVNKPDLYGYPLQVTQINILDSLAVSAVLVMGEGNEQTPFAIIQNAPKITFLNRPPTSQEEKEIKIPLEKDLYTPLLQKGKWVKNNLKN